MESYINTESKKIFYFQLSASKALKKLPDFPGFPWLFLKLAPFPGLPI